MHTMRYDDWWLTNKQREKITQTKNTTITTKPIFDHMFCSTKHRYKNEMTENHAFSLLLFLCFIYIFNSLCKNCYRNDTITAEKIVTNI